MKLYKLNPRYSWKKLAAGCIILEVEQGTYFTMNETAAVIWDGIVGGKDEGAIAESLADDYAISLKQAQADVSETIGMLVREGVLECGTGSAAPKQTGQTKNKSKE